ncbi:MAG TPA: PQQ-dependent sugar dehydrogenase [Flavilitoribacter sp.]|nr:PQQ-dependent sugar dehydrogenase [Flavilitoribacter sp.]
MNKRFLVFVFAFSFAGFLAAQTKIALNVYAGGFTRPVDIVNAGDSRLFIVEQRGIIKIIDGNGQVLSTPFLDIDARVGSQGNEQGLLGLAFHPDYANNGFFYVNYTNNSGDTRISRFKVSAGNPNVADPNSEKVLLPVDQPYSNHNAGDLTFGPDGYLYFGLGDGGSGGDPQNNGQTATAYLGKLLRIDVDNGDPYAIPPTNPFKDTDFYLDEIWATGLRNPWRFSFDRLTGDLWIGDVGQDAWEEIDFQPASSTGGENYGWRCYEGNHVYSMSGSFPDMSQLTFPVTEYSHSVGGCSVNGGFVYRGQAFPALYGKYIYSDYCSGRFWTLTPDGQGGWDNEEVLNGANNTFVSFGEDKDGELYVSALNGNVYRLVDICSALTVEADVQQVTCNGTADGAINLSVSTPASSQSFQWSNDAATEDLTGLSPGTYSVTVTDSNGCTQERSFEITEPAPLEVVIQTDGNMLSASPGFAAYQWLLDGQELPNAVQADLTAATSGMYTVRVTDANGCQAVSDPVNVQINRTFEALGVRNWTILPNPVKGEIQVRLQTDQKQVLTVRVLDMGGVERLKSNWEISGDSRKVFSAEDLSPGVYWLVLERNGLRAAAKFVKI